MLSALKVFIAFSDFELVDFALISEETQFGRFQILNIGPCHLADAGFSLTVFALIE